MNIINSKLLDPGSQQQICENFNRMYKMAEAIKDGVAKSNTNATAEPTESDDDTEGYKIGSTWIYNGVTYTCIDNTSDHAVWVSTTDIYYFDSWSALVSAISQVGVTYVGKHATVANANSAPSSGQTYTAPATLTDIIVDGGSATLKVNAQGTNYSVTCQVRTVTNPVIASVMLVAGPKPTTPSYRIFAVIPTDGLPAGVNLNDIAYFNGTVWSVFQTYSTATAVLVAGTTTNTQITWRKFNGTWMSTADDFIPDGNEYQTGKLYNGKAVFRKCIDGNAGVQGEYKQMGYSVPVTGVVLLVSTAIRFGTNQVTISFSPEAFCYISTAGSMCFYHNNVGFTGKACMMWAEYTKS